MGLLDTLSRFWPHLASGFHVLAALLASIHALLHKRDSRSATLWLVTIWFLPVLGPILYLALGINRNSLVSSGSKWRGKERVHLNFIPC